MTVRAASQIQVLGTSCAAVFRRTLLRDWIVHLAKSDVDSIRSRGNQLIGQCRSCCIGLNAWVTNDQMLPYGFSLERDGTPSNPR